jgi:uncharacterized protein (DUF983 family)
MHPPSLSEASLGGLCPQCGGKTLFEGPLRFAPRCRNCGLDFSSYNVGDGPAAFLTLIIGAVVTVLALVVDANFRPSLWIHILLWVPLTAVAVVASLRLTKAALLLLEFRHKAAEGRREDQ